MKTLTLAARVAAALASFELNDKRRVKSVTTAPDGSVTIKVSKASYAAARAALYEAAIAWEGHAAEGILKVPAALNTGYTVLLVNDADKNAVTFEVGFLCQAKVVLMRAREFTSVNVRRTEDDRVMTRLGRVRDEHGTYANVWTGDPLMNGTELAAH